MARPKCFFNRARAVFDRRLIAFKRLRIFAVFVRFSRCFGCLTSQCGWAACLLIRLFGAFPRLGRMHPFRNAPVITSAPVFMRPAVIFLTPYSLRQSVVFRLSRRFSSSGSVLTDMVLPSVRPACPCGCAGCFRTACVEFAAYSRMGKIASPTAFLRRSHQLLRN